MSPRTCRRCGAVGHNRRTCTGTVAGVDMPQIPAQLDPRARPDLIPVGRRTWEQLIPYMIKREPLTPEAMVQARADVEPLVGKLLELSRDLGPLDRYRTLERLAEAMLTDDVDQDVDEAETLGAIRALVYAQPSYRHVEWNEEE